VTTAAAMNITREEAAARAAALTVDAYEVSLDLTRGAEHFHTATTVTFAATQDAVGTHTWIDFVAEQAPTVTLNGEALDVADFDGARLRIGPLAAQNTLVVDGLGDYSNTGEGLHRFVDPVDQEVYLYTQFEVPDSRRMFAVFEQPDLKAAFRFTVTAPAHWAVVSNQPEDSRRTLGVVANEENLQGVDAAVWEFTPTPRISSYITALVAGPYASVHSELTSADGRTIPLGVYCRASLVEHLDAENVFELTRQGFEFFEAQYGHAYPFEKYDQLFVPEFNAGAMENAGCVTFLESYVFRGTVPEALIERRAITILHELAHMWFGDLVTMRWWNDLWLNESFAEFMSTLAAAENTQYTSAWTTFSSMEKNWAYRQDQLSSTHPIKARIRDLDDVLVNFDGITYAKGASVLKQLAAYVGRDAFFDAAHRYFAAHAWGNASLADFMAALEAASGRAMRAWADAWLHTSGVPRLRVDVDGDAPVLRQEGTDPVTGESILRPHVLKVGVFTPGQDGVLRRTAQVTADVPGGAEGAAVPLPDLEVPGGVRLVLPNDEDLTYAAVALDADSLRAALTHPIADPLAEATVWAALWSMTRDGELPVARFLDAVATLSARIATAGVHAQVLAQAAAAVGQYARAEDRDALRSRLGEVLAEQTRTLEAGSDRQRTAARTWATLARADVGMAAALEAALLGEDAAAFAPGLAVDAELRWLVLQALAATGRADQDRLDAELEAGRTAQTVTWHRLAAAARPEAEVKAAAWEAVMSGRTATGTELSNDLLSATAAGFAAGEVELLAPYESGFWPRLTSVWASRSNGLASRAIGGLFPARQDAVAGGADAQESHPTLAAAQRWLDEHPDAPGALRRLVVEHTDALRRSLRVQAVQPAG